MTNTGPSFLDLPLELRDMVFDELFQGLSLTGHTSSIRPDLGATFHFFYKFNGTHKHRSLPRWLFTCKQIYNEAMVQWYREASCSPCFCNSETGRTPAGSYAQAFCQVGRAQSFDGPVLRSKHASDGDYVLWEKQSTEHTEPVKCFVPSISEHPVSYAVLDCFHKYLEDNTNHPAKKIKFSLSMEHCIWDHEMPTVSSVDLSSFEALGPRFERVTFRIVCPKVPDGHRDLPHMHRGTLNHTASTYLNVQDEAIKAAKYLVGGKGWEIRDYLLPIRTANDEIMPNASEWHVEVTRREKQEMGRVQYMGMRSCRFYGFENTSGSGRGEYFDYLRPHQTNAQGEVSSWINDATGKVLSLK
jgi:hypothetical protein